VQAHTVEVGYSVFGLKGSAMIKRHEIAVDLFSPSLPSRTVISSKQILLTLKSLIRRDVSATNLAGPVGITHQLTIVVEQGTFTTLLYFLALISINLGLLNLLPFPILDGGHLVFLAIEKIKGSPVDVRVQEWAMNIAFFLILTLAVYVTFNDIRRLIR